MTLSDRAAAGASLLDRELPGWWEKIDTEKLMMRSECRCVLGLLYSDYFEGLRKLSRSDEWGPRHGFDLFEEADDWADLDRLWLAAIAERRAGEVA